MVLAGARELTDTVATRHLEAWLPTVGRWLSRFLMQRTGPARLGMCEAIAQLVRRKRRRSGETAESWAIRKTEGATVPKRVAARW